MLIQNIFKCILINTFEFYVNSVFIQVNFVIKLQVISVLIQTDSLSELYVNSVSVLTDSLSEWHGKSLFKVSEFFG